MTSKETEAIGLYWLGLLEIKSTDILSKEIATVIELVPMQNSDESFGKSSNFIFLLAFAD